MEAPLQVAVLGCGPTGLAAAHAVKAAVPGGGSIVRIFSKKRKSHLYGAQYLHAPIPGLPHEVDSAQVTYLLQGSADGYRRKVYGEDFSGNVSPEDLLGNHMAWDIRSTYHYLWLMYEKNITDSGNLTPGDLNGLVEAVEYDVVINTIPRPVLCKDKHTHKFNAIEVWAMGDAPEVGSFSPIRLPGDNMVVCNGDSYPAWYRASRIFNYNTTEWPLAEGWDFASAGAARVKKPVSTDCDCWTWERDGFLHVGRYGAWAKGYLVHHAYAQVFQVLFELERLGYYSGDPNKEVAWS